MKAFSPNSKIDHRQWNENMARLYDPDSFITRSGFFIRAVQKMRFRAAAGLLAAAPQDYVLDIGCGSGNLLEIIPHGRLFGMDLSDALIEKAKKRLGGKSSVAIVKGDAENLPFPGGFFTKIICSETLEHVARPKQALDEILRVAAPRGRIVITWPDEQLINKTKRLVIKLGLKKCLAGNYRMSDNMLDQWHIQEISKAWILNQLNGRAALVAQRDVPVKFLAYHHLLCLKKIK